MSIFMKFNDVKGDVVADKFKHTIELQSFEFTIEKNFTQETGNQRRNICSPQFSKITLSKFMDSATPQLINEMITGTAAKCTIFFVKNNSQSFVEYNLDNAVITKYNPKKFNESQHCTEFIEISYTTISIIYTPFDSAGKRGTPLCTGYDIGLAKRI